VRALVLSSILLLSAAAAPVAAARTETPSFELYEGEWTFAGVAYGKSADGRMTWEKAPGGWRLDWRIRFTQSAGGGGFQGTAFYLDKGEGKYVGAWADSNGDHFPLEASDDGVTVTTHWGGNGPVRGRSVYELTEDGSLWARDSLRQADGFYKPFNEIRFSRQGD